MARQRFDVTRFVGGVIQGIPKPANGGIQPSVKINKCAFRPQLHAQLVAGYEFAGALQQQLQNLKRLILKFQADAVLAQLERIEVSDKTAELGPPGNNWGCHRGQRMRRLYADGFKSTIANPCERSTNSRSHSTLAR